MFFTPLTNPMFVDIINKQKELSKQYDKLRADIEHCNELTEYNAFYIRCINKSFYEIELMHLVKPEPFYKACFEICSQAYQRHTQNII